MYSYSSVLRGVFGSVALAAILPAVAARGDGLPPAAYEKAKAATVEILVNGHLNGSGWIADAKGLVITAGHVVEQPDRRFEVIVPGIGRKDARLLAVDLGHDLALLSIEPRKGGYPCLKLAEKWPAPGTAVYVIGAPLYRHSLLAPGTVAGTETAFEYYADRFNEVMHVAATVPRGMSGGPWIDVTGDVVGVQSGVMSQNGAPIGIAFSCPLPAMRGLLERKRSAATPSLGLIVEELWSQDRKTLDRFGLKAEGLIIKTVQADGPAARGGIKDSDLIVAADGRPVRLTSDLLRAVFSRQPGQSLELTLQRPDGAGQTKATVRLGKLETAWP
jgi:S1-C subfamily serine protease